MADIIKTARRLRRDQTDAEKLLWSRLRNSQLENYKFRRQHPLPPYIADFFCEQKNLIVEVDGGQHTPEYDAERTAYLEERGYKIARFWNHEVLKNIEGVLETILLSLKSPSPSLSASRNGPLPLPGGEGEKRVCLGKITNAHGIRGLVKIMPFGDDPKLIETLGPVFTNETGPATLTITMKNSAGNKFWLAAVEGITERNGAEALRNTELYVSRDKLPELDNGHYYTDLIGLKAVDESGAEIGEVVSVQNFGAGDLLEIQAKGKDSFYLPFTKENVKEVKEKFISVAIPEGLI